MRCINFQKPTLMPALPPTPPKSLLDSLNEIGYFEIKPRPLGKVLPFAPKQDHEEAK